MSWYERVSDRVRDAAIVRDLIESVECLPGLDSWSPPDGLENHRIELIGWGFVLWMTRSLDGSESVQKALAAEILAGGRPVPETFAELSGAGLCVAHGAVAGRRIPRGGSKTADWRMVWPPDADVDFEVTVAKRKKKHVERRALAIELANALFRPDREFDLVVDLVDPTVAEDRAAILAVAEKTIPGQPDGLPGRWQLLAQEITREPKVLVIGGQDPRPAWWSVGNARCFVLHGQLAGPDTRCAPPQVRVSFGVPYDSYINPIMRKADFPQGAPGLPFLVAVDISSLPGAFIEMPTALAGFLPFWKTVSGILLFHDVMGVDRVGWLWRLLKNPHAAVTLPEALCDGRADLPQMMETGVRISKECEVHTEESV